MLRSIALPIVVLSFAVSLAEASEWTRFRGPNGTGVGSANVPSEFSVSDFRFRTELPGDSGCSSPVIWGGKAFLMSADSSDATRFVICVDADSGDLLWSKSFASTAHHLHSRSTYASCTPAVDEQHVYVAWSTPEQTLLKAFTHDGEQAWSKDLGTWQSQHGFGTSPIVYNGMVILHNSQQADKLGPGETPGSSYMMAFDAKTGQEKWRTELVSRNVCYSVPFIYEGTDGDELVCSSTGNGIFSLDPVTGRKNWSVDDGLFSMRTVGSPIAAGGHIFGSTGSGRYSSNYIVAVKPGADANLAYTISNGSNFKAPYVPCLLADGDLVFCLYDKGFASCIDAKSGEIHWTKRTGAALSGSPVRVDDRIFCIDEAGTLWCWAASTEYRLLGKSDLLEASRATPAIANGRMYLRTDTHLICVGGE